MRNDIVYDPSNLRTIFVLALGFDTTPNSTANRSKVIDGKRRDWIIILQLKYQTILSWHKKRRGPTELLICNWNTKQFYHDIERVLDEERPNWIMFLQRAAIGMQNND